MSVRSFKTSSIRTGEKRSKFWDQSTVILTPAFESIAYADGTGSSGTITFSSIPSTYQHLQIRAIMRNSAAASDASFGQMRVNGDTTTANYAWHELYGDGASVSASGANDGLPYYGTVVRNNATSGIVGVTIIDIHDYASTSKYKTIRVFTGNDRNGSGDIVLWSGLWENTNAITSLDFLAGGANNFTTATSFALYGIKAA